MENNKLKFSLLTNIENIDRIELIHNYIIDLYYDDAILNTMFGKVYKYFSLIDNERDIFSENEGKEVIFLSSFLLGSKIKIFNLFNELVFECYLGLKNSDYEENYNLKYNYKSRSFSSYNADNSFFSYLLLFVITFLLLLIIFAILCNLRKKKKFDISFERVKVEE